MALEKKQYTWNLIVYQKLDGKYSLSATRTRKSYESHLNMVRSFNTFIAVKEETTKEEKITIDKLVEAKNNGKIIDIKTELLLNLGFTLPRLPARQSS